MTLADAQQVFEFLRWIGKSQGISPSAARSLCAFFYGKPIGTALRPEEA